MKPELSQWMTPYWAAEELVQMYFPQLGAGDLVWEPTCGTGAFLRAIPAAAAALGRVQADHLPRSLFPRLTHPLVFAMFHKEATPRLVGFALYQETFDIERMPEVYREALCRGGTWKAAVAAALWNLGGEASLGSVYRAIEGRRPTPNRWWKEKVRQILQRDFRSLGDGRWALPPLGEAA